MNDKYKSEEEKIYEDIEKRISLADSRAGLLDLSDMHYINEFPKGIFKGKNIKNLVMKTSIGASAGGRQKINMSELNDLKNLEKITLRRISIEGLDFSAFRELREISISSGDPSDLVGIEQCKKLIKFHVVISQLEKLNMLKDMEYLAYIHVNHSRVSYLEDLGYLPSLVSLDVSNTNILDIPYIMNFPNFSDGSAEHLGFKETPSAALNNPMRLLSGMRGRECVKQTIMYLKGEHPDLKDFSGIIKPLKNLLSEASPIEVITTSGKIALENIGPAERNNPIELRERLIALRAHIEILIDESAFVQCPQSVQRRLRAFLVSVSIENPVFYLLDTHAHFLESTVSDKYVLDMLDMPLLQSIKKLVADVSDLKPLMMPPPDAEAAAIDRIPDIKPEVVAGDFLDVAQQAHRLLSDENLNKDIDPSVIEAIAVFEDNLDDVSKRNNRASLKKIASKFSGFISLLSDVTTIHSWFATYAVGLNVVNQIQEMLKKIISFFNI